MANPLRLLAPLDAWCLPLAGVPDPVFAQGMAGDGLALDPLADTLCAPCDGEVMALRGARHAITLRAESGIEVMMHVGIDTVSLGGEGFDLVVAPGDRVRAGDPLIRFDLDLLARRVPSLVTPVLVASGGSIVRRAATGRIRRGDLLMQVAPAGGLVRPDGGDAIATREFSVPFEHGLHVRPAATVAAAVKPFASQVTFHLGGREADARSPVAMMALGARCGDTLVARARGADAQAALAALDSLLAPVSSRTPGAVAGTPAPFTRGRLPAAIASRGIVVGPAVRWQPPQLPVAEQGRGREAEDQALAGALERVRAHLRETIAETEAERAVLTAHAELLDDPQLRRHADESIAAGKSAGHAWRSAARAVASALEALQDERLRERAADVRDLEMQVLRVLAGKPPQGREDFPPGAIVLAEDLLPSQLGPLLRAQVGGFCTARGGPTSHVAILASAAGLPGLVAAGPAVHAIAEGTALVLDAEHGWLDVDPPEHERGAASRVAAARAVEHAADLQAARAPAITIDGTRIEVHANVGSAAEAEEAMRHGADGCGLLRTEFLFLDRREPPSEEEQCAEYQRIARALQGRPLAIRTLDVGGDKPIAYVPMPREENPALGLRGVRATLRQPELLRAQLRAILRAGAPGQCRVLVPMVTERSELEAVRALLAEGAAGAGVPMPSLGAMVETPACALLAAHVAGGADFFSIGTNDLSQYTLAIDRGHPELAARLDALHPAVLRLVAQVTQAAQAAGKPVAVCGALASDSDALPILAGLGVHEISATPAAIPRLKRLVRGLDLDDCRELARRALEQPDAAAVRELATRQRARAKDAALDGGGR